MFRITRSVSGAVASLCLIASACAAPSGSTGGPGDGATPAPSTPPGSEPAASESTAASPSGPPSLADVAAFNVTVVTAPDWPVLLAGSLWVLAPDGDDPAVVRLDPATGAEQARISLPGGQCEMLGAGFDSLWACTPDGVVRIDAATDAIVATIPFRTAEAYGRAAVSEDAVWALGGEIVPTDLVRIDPASNAVTATYPLGHVVSRLAYGFGYLWATATRDGLLLRIDPASGEVTTAVSDLVDPLVVAIGAGRVWVGLQGVGTDEDPDPSVPDLFRFDPSAGTSDSFDFDLRPEELGDIYITSSDAWVQAIGPFLMRLDPETGAIVWTAGSDLGTGALVASDEALFMTLWRANAVVRIDL